MTRLVPSALIPALSIAVIAALGCGSSRPALREEAARHAIALDGVSEILRVLDSVPLVALYDEHGLEDEGEFYLRLIRDPRSPGKINDFVLELANELYQPLADRYVRGDSVPADSVRMIWENTTQAGLLTPSFSMYTAILPAIREVNERLPASRRFRALLGDPAVEWKTVTRSELWRAHLRRGSRMAEIARDSVVGKGRRAVLISGGSHLERTYAPADSLQLNDRRWGALSSRVFLVETHLGFAADGRRHEPSMDSLPKGAIIHLRSHAFGQLDEAVYRTPIAEPGAPAPAMRPIGSTLHEARDALLYLGPISAMRRSTYEVERIRADTAYLTEIQRRTCMVFGRGLDTAQLFNTPSALLFPGGRRGPRGSNRSVQRQSAASAAPSAGPPAEPPPLPPVLPPPCDRFTRRP